MRSPLNSITITLLALAFGGCSEAAVEESPVIDVEPSASPSPQIDLAKVEAMKRLIESETGVIDYVWQPAEAVQWTIGVKDDGSPRWGYAEYFCGKLSDLGIDSNGQAVRIVDYQTYLGSGGDAHAASLGAVDCGTGRHDIYS